MGCRVRWNPSAGHTWEAFRLSCEYCQYVGGSPDSCQYLTRNILLVHALKRPSCPESRKWLGMCALSLQCCVHGKTPSGLAGSSILSESSVSRVEALSSTTGHANICQLR